MITSIAVEVVELAQLDHLSWQGPLGPRSCRWAAELGDGRHREPRQVSAVTHDLSAILVTSTVLEAAGMTQNSK
jgi:hypothetical protein